MRVEYGARVVCVAAVVYVKDFNKAVVTAWIETMTAVTPIELVTRMWGDGDTHTGWELAA